MHMTFSNAANFQAPRALFIAGWKVWFKRYSDDHYGWREGKMPLHNESSPFHQLIKEKHRFTVEVLTRIMVPWSFRDTLQVDDEFLRLNPAVLRPVPCACETSDELVDGARLTDQALDYWDSLTYIEQDLFLKFAEARIQADIETPSSDPVILDDFGVELIGEDIYPPFVPDQTADEEEFIRALVAWIDEDPFQPMYQRAPVGEAVSSWHDRLLAFFWPKPRSGYLEYSHAVSPLVYRAGLIAEHVEKKRNWSLDDKALATKTAHEIFMLAGVPQRDVTWENVKNVVEAAINADEQSTAKMNSGWTYLASLSTAHFDCVDGKVPLISLNSRTASSLLSRLDFLLVEAGVEKLDARFSGLGTIPGWGGTRPREYSLPWPSAYRSWKSLIATSRVVDRMCHFLNNELDAEGQLKYKPMPLAGGKTGRWTSRGVQLVLFTDGY